MLGLGAVGAVGATDPRLQGDTSDGREKFEGRVRSFDGAGQSISIPSLIGDETVASSLGTSTPTVIAGALGFTAGTCQLVKLSNGSIYPLEDSQTIAYDVSGNDNHGTYIGNPPLVTDNTAPSEYMNTYGYSEVGTGNYVPALLDQSAAADGSPLQYKGSIYAMDWTYSNANALSFDGAGQYIDTTTSSFGFAEITVVVTGLALSSGDWFVGSRLSGSTGFGLGRYFDKLGGLIGSQTFDIINGGDISDGEFHHCAITADGLTVRLYLDGLEVYSGSQLGGVGNSLIVSIGALNNNSSRFGLLDGKISEVEIFNKALNPSDILHLKKGGVILTDLIARYPLAEGAGDDVFDVSGSNQHGLKIGNPTNVQAPFESYNTTNGFSLYEHATLDPIRVPYDVNGNPITYTPPAGYSLSGECPAVPDGHNNSENTMELESTPSSVPLAIAPFRPQDGIPYNVRARNVGNDSFDRITAFDEANASLEQLEVINKYTQDQ